MSLFAEDAHTKAQRDREAIRLAYNQFFQGTQNRRLRLRDLTWTHDGQDTLIGRSPFVLTLKQEGQKKPVQFRGTIIFHVVNRSPHLLITQFDYEYNENQ